METVVTSEIRVADLSYEEYRAIWNAMSDAERERVREKCRWERMGMWAVLNEWPSLRTAGPKVES